MFPTPRVRPIRPRPSRRRAAVAASIAVLGGAGLALVVPSAASAHVVVSPDQIVAGSYGVLTFSFAHGCEDSPTTALRITMPEGLTSVAPTVDGDWEISTEIGDDGLVSAVTYTALTPVPNHFRGAVSMSVGLDEDTPASLAFPVVQQCVDGATEWSQLAENGEDPHSLDAPAPVLTVTEAAAGEGDTSADGHVHAGHAPASATTAARAGAADATAERDPLPMILGGGGLIAGVAALTISVLAYRRRA